jgi:hypothetical protein
VPGFTAALGAEVRKMVEKIPSSELDPMGPPGRGRYLETTLMTKGWAAENEAERLMAPSREISPQVLREVPAGYHSCFGTLNGWPSWPPKDLTGSVLLINAAAATSDRPVDFVHIPTLGSAGNEFFNPPSNLRIGVARVYLGLIHQLNGFHV